MRLAVPEARRLLSPLAPRRLRTLLYCQAPVSTGRSPFLIRRCGCSAARSSDESHRRAAAIQTWRYDDLRVWTSPQRFFDNRSEAARGDGRPASFGARGRLRRRDLPLSLDRSFRVTRPPRKVYVGIKPRTRWLVLSRGWGRPDQFGRLPDSWLRSRTNPAACPVNMFRICRINIKKITQLCLFLLHHRYFDQF